MTGARLFSEYDAAEVAIAKTADFAAFVLEGLSGSLFVLVLGETAAAALFGGILAAPLRVQITKI